ncbi:DTW domain-containing protein [Meloidogyne graminicola]|uniref:tRNA-uridine aminocarboxypropyltransferase 1 n=1 Tax=Meloidogyne graminicola TaxID=189291 RepID=A0A8S9ZKA3_9BILA|nr:DTW domain-containing protein [Meloidogyne graminicola]
MSEIITNQLPSSSLFTQLQLTSFQPIKNIKERLNCKICGRKRMYFCYSCRVYIGDVGNYIPKVKKEMDFSISFNFGLPFSVDIIKHRLELDGKSTAIHAILLAPEQTRIFDNFVDVPDYRFSPSTVVLCPSKCSISIDQYFKNFGPIKTLVVLDSTWNTVNTLKRLPQLEGLTWVHLCNYSTEYWRPQKGFSSEYLATIEAIYFACKEYIEIINGQIGGVEKDNEIKKLDGLLFWFYFFREIVNKN